MNAIVRAGSDETVEIRAIGESRSVANVLVAWRMEGRRPHI
jgi:hypothetical protein